MKSKLRASFIFGIFFLVYPAIKADIEVQKVSNDLSSDPQKILTADFWKKVKEDKISLTAQPMAIPRPKKAQTDQVLLKSVHDGTWIAFLLRWKDTELSEAGPLGKFSDAVAIQFPGKEGPPPPVFMGAKDQPVHIFHWRAQYQRDKTIGKPNMKDIYPNMSIDMYPMEFKDEGHLEGLNDEKREVFSHGRAAGNPQSYAKTGLDEIMAEGFGSSSVIGSVMGHAHGVWKNGEWQVVILRPLKRENGSVLEPGKPNFAGFAVWQGGRDEVGSRKAVTMSWTPLDLHK